MTTDMTVDRALISP